MQYGAMLLDLQQQLNLLLLPLAQSLADLCSISVAESERMMTLGRKALEGESC